MTPPSLAAELPACAASASVAVAPPALVADAPRGFAATLADVSRLVRPRIAVMVLATVAAAAWLTAGRPSDPARLLWVLAGTALVAASSSIANQILERRTDRLMQRTASRPLVAGRLAVSAAWWLTALTLAAGTAVCWIAAGWEPAAAAVATWLLYVLLYTPLKRITPPSSLMPSACKLPVLRTTPPKIWLAAWADKMIKPPGACTARPFSTSTSMVAGVTITLARPLWPLNCISNASPAAIATVPMRAITTPLLRTSGASKAI